MPETNLSLRTRVATEVTRYLRTQWNGNKPVAKTDSLSKFGIDSNLLRGRVLRDLKDIFEKDNLELAPLLMDNASTVSSLIEIVFKRLKIVSSDELKRLVTAAVKAAAALEGRTLPKVDGGWNFEGSQLGFKKLGKLASEIFKALYPLLEFPKITTSDLGSHDSTNAVTTWMLGRFPKNRK